MPLLQVSQLNIALPTPRGLAQAVRGLDFTLERGETLGLIGESGCGKSLTALALMGLLPERARASGSVRLDGQELLGMPDAALCRIRGQRMAMVFQEPMTALNPLHRIGDQVAEPLRLHSGLGRAQARRQAQALLERVGIANAAQRMDAYPHQFSGGQRQRITIAMALACGPDLLIADEPTTALDVTLQQQILALIAELVAERQMALILISHDLGVIAQNVDRMLVMYGGSVVERGATASVFSALAHPYTRGLLAARPQMAPVAPTGQRPRLATIAGTVPELADLPSGCPFAGRCAFTLPTCHTTPPPAVQVTGDHVAYCLRPEAMAPALGSALGTAPIAPELIAASAQPARARGRFDAKNDALAPAPARALAAQPKTPDLIAFSAHSTRAGGRFDAQNTPASDPPLLQVCALARSYPLARERLFAPRPQLHALQGVDFSVIAGRSVGIVGESGSGKSTLARLVMALDTPSAGSVQLLGQDLHALPAPALRQARRDMQMVFQDPYGSLDPRQRIARIVTEPLQALGTASRAEQRAQAAAVLAQVGLRSSDLDKYPHEFSGGQRQRIAIARALITRPRLIVADEPVSALDVSVQAQVLNLMQDLQQQCGVTYLLISHDLAVVNHLCDEVLVLYQGRIVERGAPGDLFQNAQHPYTRTLVDAVPRITPGYTRVRRSAPPMV